MSTLLFRTAALIAAFAAPLAQADNLWCVNNTASFEQALQSAREDDTTIKLVRGEYQTLNIDVLDIDHDLTILGGYANASCSEAGRSLDPALTVFRPLTIGGAYRFELTWLRANLLIKSVTFRGYGYGVEIVSNFDIYAPDKVWTFDRVRVENSGGLSDLGSLSEAFEINTLSNADVLLRQVVVADNAAGEDCSATAYAGNDDLIVQQSTFANNAGTGLCVFGDGGKVDIDNNIFWGNACGLRVEDVAAADLHLRRNTIDCNSFEALPSINLGNDSLDPQFLDSPNRNYRLAASSPAVDAGINPPTGGTPGSDISGGARVIGSGIDRGPWETDVDNASILFVTTTAPSGTGSLAAAIAQSNALAGTQVIRFNIPGACPQVIFQFQNQQLQAISDSVRIEGYSQPGSVRGLPDARTICVGLWGNQEVPTLLTIDLASSPSVDISGMGFGGTNFDAGAAALRLLAGSGHQISANQFGGFIGPASNRVALNVLQSGIVAGFNASDSVIGGFDPEQGNVFNSARGAAIELGTTTAPSALFRLVNNFVGLRGDGTTVDANGSGITINNSAGNFVLYNWIGGNSGDGLLLKGERSDGNYLVANQIGRCPSLLCNLPIGSESLRGNGGHGILLQSGADANIVNGNRIAGNGFGYAEEHGANGNLLVQNLIYRNTGLGIDIGRDGVTPNDNGGIAPDGVPNFPVLAAAGGGFYAGSARGTLSASGGHDYIVELYASDDCDGSGYGEGQRFVGRVNVTTPPPNPQFPSLYTSAAFEASIRSTGLADKAITAIARSANGASSEFSACRPYLYSDIIFQDGFD